MTALRLQLRFRLIFFIQIISYIDCYIEWWIFSPNIPIDRIHDFLGVESSNLRMASVICFLYLYSIILEELLVPMEIQVSARISVATTRWILNRVIVNAIIKGSIIELGVDFVLTNNFWNDIPSLEDGIKSKVKIHCFF